MQGDASHSRRFRLSSDVCRALHAKAVHEVLDHKDGVVREAAVRALGCMTAVVSENENVYYYQINFPLMSDSPHCARQSKGLIYQIFAFRGVVTLLQLLACSRHLCQP